MKRDKLIQLTDSYHDDLIKSLKNKKEAAIYLQVSLDEFQEDGDMAVLLLALRHVTEAQGGFAALAKKTHLNRQSLYRTLSKQGNPRLHTLGLLLKGLGFHLAIESTN